MPSSAALLKTSALAFAVAAPLHAYLSFERLFPVFEGKGDPRAAYILKLISIQLSGGFILNTLLMWRWATTGVESSLDRAAMLWLVGTNLAMGAAFVAKGIIRVPPVPLLFGTSAMVLASQM